MSARSRVDYLQNCYTFTRCIFILKRNFLSISAQPRTFAVEENRHVVHWCVPILFVVHHVWCHSDVSPEIQHSPISKESCSVRSIYRFTCVV